jgi:methylisocitrate lyase
MPIHNLTPRTAAFHRLHQVGCFVIPNPWDAGSARLLAQLGFPALATTSSGFAWSQGRSDNHVTLDQALEHFRIIAASVEIPVNADFEGGFAITPADVGKHVALCAQTGVAGLSIEDSTPSTSLRAGGKTDEPLFEFNLAVERIRAAREAIDKAGTGVLLTGRCEGFLVGRPNISETIDRLKAYAAAGADCLYAPGLRSKGDVMSVVDAVAPKPVNVLVGSDVFNVRELAEVGVRRISVGGALARSAWGGFLTAAREIAEHGTFTNLGRAVPFAEINAAFKAWDQ